MLADDGMIDSDEDGSDGLGDYADSFLIDGEQPLILQCVLLIMSARRIGGRASTIRPLRWDILLERPYRAGCRGRRESGMGGCARTAGDSRRRRNFR